MFDVSLSLGIRFVVKGGYAVGLLEDAQVGQRTQVVDAQLCNHDCLVIDANEEHKVLHAAYLCLLGITASAEDFAEYRHDVDLRFNYL